MESLRGLGAFLVAGYHVSGWGGPQGYLLPHQPWTGVGPFQNIVGQIELHLLAGHAALMVFFVISGFVLRVSLQYGPRDFAHAALRFHVARFFRIYPIVVVGMLLAAVTYTFHTQPPPPPLSWSTLAANLLLLSASLNTTLWAIQLEVVMAPLIVLLYFLELRGGVRLLVAISGVATVLAFANWTFWRPLSEYFFAFGLGMLLPTVGRGWVLGLSTTHARRWLAVAMLGLLLPGPLLGFYTKFSAVVEGYAAALFVCLVAYRTDLPSLRVLDWRPIRALGQASGSFYVLHASALPWIFPLVMAVIPAVWSRELPTIFGPLAILVTLGLFTPIAVLSYRTVEAPGIALGRRVNASRALVPAE